jgi:hypothetical protein
VRSPDDESSDPQDRGPAAAGRRPAGAPLGAAFRDDRDQLLARLAVLADRMGPGLRTLDLSWLSNGELGRLIEQLERAPVAVVEEPPPPPIAPGPRKAVLDEAAEAEIAARIALAARKRPRSPRG